MGIIPIHARSAPLGRGCAAEVCKAPLPTLCPDLKDNNGNPQRRKGGDGPAADAGGILSGHMQGMPP